MGRGPRTDEPGAWHHVANRGARRHQTFHDATDCLIFLHFLGEAKERFEIETHAFCLMGNHFHLLIHSPHGNLAAAMQMIGTNYTRRFNRRHGFDGRLFKGPYWANRIGDDSYLLEASRYIHRNPLDLGPTISPVTYDWSSLKHYLSPRRVPAFLSVGMISRMAGGPDGYRSFVNIEGSPRDDPYITRAAGLPALSSGSAGNLVIPTGTQHRVRLDDIDNRLAQLTDTSIDRVRFGGRGNANLSRFVAIHAAYRLTAAPAGEICSHYHFATSNSMDRAMRRSGLTEHSTFLELHRRLLDTI